MDMSSHNWTTLLPKYLHPYFLVWNTCLFYTLNFVLFIWVHFNFFPSMCYSQIQHSGQFLFFFSYFSEAQVNEMPLICLLVPTITGIWYFVPVIFFFLQRQLVVMVWFHQGEGLMSLSLIGFWYVSVLGWNTRAHACHLLNLLLFQCSLGVWLSFGQVI